MSIGIGPGVVRDLQPVDVVMVTYRRPHFLKKVVEEMYRRTAYPMRLLVVNNAADDIETIEFLKKAKLEGFIFDYLTLDENKGAAEAYNMGIDFFQKTKVGLSEYFVVTQEDILPPLLRPCWLERLLHLFKENELEYSAISCRIERTRHRKIDEFEPLIDSAPSLSAVLRMQKKEEILGANNFGDRKHWESTSFVKRMTFLKKKFAIATHLYASHIGFMVPNKGYKAGFTDYFTYSPERVTQGQDQPYPDIEPKSNIPIKINNERDEKEQQKREDYWKYWGRDKRTILKPTHEQKMIGKYAVGEGVDIGCGKVKCNVSAIGVDVYPHPCVDIISEVNDLWMFRDESLDYVLNSHVLEHMADFIGALKEWKRVLKVGGVLACAVPDGGKKPKYILKEGHKNNLSLGTVRLVLERILKMKILRAEYVPGKRENQFVFLIVAQKI